MKKLIITAILGIFFAAVMSIAASAETHQPHSGHCDHEGWIPFTNDELFLNDFGIHSGNYYLTEDITCNYLFAIDADTTINLCLNGYSFTSTRDHAIFTFDGGTFNLYDESGNSGLITHAAGCNGNVFDIGATHGVANVTMYGGRIAGNTNNYSGAVSVGYDSTFTMNGGEISGNLYNNDNIFYGGGGVCVIGNGRFIMNGGTISGNTSVNTGGGVFLRDEATFTMNGGTITGNTAASEADGMNVYIFTGDFTMNGGTISGGFVDDGNRYVTVSFDANGGTGTMSEQYIRKDTATTLKANTFTRAGYTLIGWKNVDGTVYTDGQSVTIAEGLELIAQWKENPAPAPEPEPAPAPAAPKNNDNEGGLILPALRITNTTVNGNTARLRWSKFPYADKFTVFMTVDGVQTKLKTTTNNSLTVKGLKNGVTYRFMVTFTVGTWTSPESLAATVTVTPYFKPLVNAKLSDGNIRLGWKGVPDAEGYIVYKLVDGKLKQIAETTGTSALITNVTSGKEYVFAVSAIINGEKTSVKKSDLIQITA